MSEKDVIKDIAVNRKAHFNYEILDTYEAGIVLRGTEVKALRDGKASIGDAYGHIKKNEIYLVAMNINIYDNGNRFNHDPLRERKLLMHKEEIRKLTGKLKERGYTLIPLKLYFKNGKVKVLLGLATGKTEYDKRHDIKKRDDQREIQRALRNR